MDLSAFTAAMTANGLGAYTALAARLAQPALRLTATPADDAAIAVGASRLGGLPDLPDGQAWPSMNGAPMSFVGQIRLQDAHTLDGGNALPAAGLLAFFYDASQQTYGADPNDRAGLSVLYFDAGAQDGLVHHIGFPAALPAAAQFNGATITLAPVATYAQDLQAEFPDRKVSAQDQKQFEAALSKLAPAPSTMPRHQLLGHPDTIQDDMRQQCQFAANGVADPSTLDQAKMNALVASANDWRLLLQVDSDQRLNMKWGSSGMLYFWIRQQDLANADFSHCWVVLQSE